MDARNVEVVSSNLEQLRLQHFWTFSVIFIFLAGKPIPLFFSSIIFRGQLTIMKIICFDVALDYICNSQRYKIMWISIKKFTPHYKVENGKKINKLQIRDKFI